MPTTGASEVVASVGCLRGQGSGDVTVFEGEVLAKMEQNSTRVNCSGKGKK